MTPPLLALWLLCGHGVIGGVPDRPHISQAPSIAPSDIGALRQEANRGDYEAQLKLAGALRTDAKGKKKVEALQWLTIAATLAPADQQERIKGERDALGREMKPKEVASAQERAAKWIDSFKASQPPQAAPPAPSPPSVSQAGSNSIESPQLVSQVRPAYTEEAKRKKIEGVVVVQAIVLPDGTVGSVKVLRSLDPTYGLDQEALKAARQWRFIPGKFSGVPVAVQITIELTFTLK